MKNVEKESYKDALDHEINVHENENIKLDTEVPTITSVVVSGCNEVDGVSYCKGGDEIIVEVTFNEALENNLNFSMVANAYVRVIDKSTGNELVKFLLTDYFSNVTSMVVGEVYNKGGQWRFNPIGDGFAHDLAGLCGVYGVNVAD